MCFTPSQLEELVAAARAALPAARIRVRPEFCDEEWIAVFELIGAGIGSEEERRVSDALVDYCWDRNWPMGFVVDAFPDVAAETARAAERESAARTTEPR